MQDEDDANEAMCGKVGPIPCHIPKYPYSIIFREKKSADSLTYPNMLWCRSELEANHGSTSSSSDHRTGLCVMRKPNRSLTKLGRSPHEVKTYPELYNSKLQLTL